MRRISCLFGQLGSIFLLEAVDCLLRTSMLPKQYTLCRNVILRSEPQYYDSYSAFNYKTVQTQALNGAEMKALRFIQFRSATVEEVSKASGINQRDCTKLLKEMLKTGFVQVNADPPKVPLPQKMAPAPEAYSHFPIPFLSAPASVDFFITGRCNLHCAHCFADKVQRQNADLSLRDVDSILCQLERMGVLEVRISGGEPLLHGDITAILRLLGEKRFRVALLTNGTLLTEEIVLALKAANITPTVSLDDSLPEEHDLFRGVKGAHERTLEGLKLLKKHGIEYGINCCLNKKNLGRYQDIIDLAAKYGASRIALLDLKPIGRMNSNAEWMPTNSDYEDTLKRLFVARAKNRKIEVSVDAFLHCYPMQESVALAKRGTVSCRAGISRLSIGCDGGVYPCNFVVSDLRWKMGSLAEESLEQIWFSPNWLFFRGQTKLGSLRKCGDCKDLKRCNDFYCRLLPYAVSGDELDAPPKCGN